MSTDNINDEFSQIAPLIDDIISRIGALKLDPFRTEWLSAQAMTRIAIGMRIVTADAQIKGDALTPEERSDLMDKLADSLRKGDAALMAMMERKGANVQ